MTPQPVPLEAMRKRILDLEIFSRGLDTHAMLRKLQELVPTFKPADLHGLPPTPPSPTRGEGDYGPTFPAPQSRTDSAQTESPSNN